MEAPILTKKKTLNEKIDESKVLENNPYINKDILLNHSFDPNQQAKTFDDFFESTISDIDDFDKESWSKKDGYVSKKFSNLTEKLEGLDEGLYLCAGESNSGKTAFMTNLQYDLCINPDNHLFGIYYSLDDAKNVVLPRIIAMNQRIPIGIAAKPQRYKNKIEAGDENSILYEEYLELRQKGIEELKKYRNYFKIEDGSLIRGAEDMYHHMNQLQLYLQAIDPKTKLIVSIDSLDDIRFANKPNMQTTERHAEIARTVKQWTVDLHIPIFGSRHLKKLNGTNRPNLDCLKDSNEYVYEASVVWLVHNDVSKNKQNASIFIQDENSTQKMPVLEIDWAKNKKSSYKGRTYNRFIPNCSLVSECSDSETQRFDQIIYSCNF